MRYFTPEERQLIINTPIQVDTEQFLKETEK